MLLVKRNPANEFAAHILARVGFIPCAGSRNDVESAALAAAFETGGSEKVRSLRRSADADGSAWYVGSNWWLSMREHEASACGLRELALTSMATALVK